jgi:hypothetical protein
MMEPYPIHAKRALQAILPFVTTYLCEAGFSTLVTIKTKALNRLDAEEDNSTFSSADRQEAAASF